VIVAIMIGRKGSSGFPGKNTTAVAGHPMAWWPLEAARNTPEIDVAYVSTDDPEIARIGADMGARLIERPAYLASNEALGEDAFVHAHQVITAELEAAGAAPELYVLLMANAVTISSAQLSEGITAMRERPDLDSAVTVSCYNMWSPLRAGRYGRRAAPAVRALRGVRRPGHAQLRPRLAGRCVVRGHGGVHRAATQPR
jgi:CMP-N-acetylneuraminic acid synthetase